MERADEHQLGQQCSNKIQGYYCYKPPKRTTLKSRETKLMKTSDRFEYKSDFLKFW